MPYMCIYVYMYMLQIYVYMYIWQICASKYVYVDIHICIPTNMYINIPSLARGFNDYLLLKYLICRMMIDSTITEYFARDCF